MKNPRRPRVFLVGVLALFLCLGDKDIASAHFLAVQFGNGTLGFLGRGHLDEPEPAAATRLAIGNDASRGYGAGGFEERLEFLLRRGERETSNEELVRHRSVRL